jgi:hypothetical protein
VKKLLGKNDGPLIDIMDGILVEDNDGKVEDPSVGTMIGP